MQIENATVHGFQSSFRDWAGSETDYPRELIETALTDVIGDKAEQAYLKAVLREVAVGARLKEPRLIEAAKVIAASQ